MAMAPNNLYHYSTKQHPMYLSMNLKKNNGGVLVIS
jgi:hypothetical protein